MKIFFTAEYDPAELDPLKEMGEITFDGWALGLPKLTTEELLAKTADADIIITTYDDITRDVIENAKNLKLIICTRATPVNIDVTAAREHNIPVIYTPGRNSDTTAEMTIGLMLSIARRIPFAHQALKEGKFLGTPKAATKEGLKTDMIWDIDKDSPYMVFKGTQLHGKTLGIIGYGSIGRRVGRIARAFGMELLIYDPYVGEIDVEEFGVRKALDLPQLMKEADFITCHLKVTPATTGLISREMLELMKPTAYFINAGRGAVLDEEAMIDILRAHRIAGAAFDVYAKEPLAKDHPYRTELDNVVITPHIAGATDDVLTNHTRMMISEIRRFLKGEPLLYQYRG